MDIKKVTNDWTHADQFLDEKYTRSKQYVDNMLDPTFIVENNTVATKAVPDKASMAMIAKICGKTVKDGTTLKSAAVESVVSVNNKVTGLTRQYWSASNTPASSTTRLLTNYIPCSNNQQIFVDLDSDKEYKIIFLNSSKAYVRQSGVISLNTFTATNDGYIMLEIKYKSGTAVDITSANVKVYTNKTTVLVPSSVKNLPDYGCSAGNIANEIDFENGVYYHRVGSVDMGTLPWGYNNNASHETMRARVTGIKKQVGGNAANIITGKFETRQNADPWNHSVNNSIGVLDTDEVIVIYSSTMGTDATAFKNSLVGQKLNYELATVETIPLSDYLRPLPVEVGGTITLVNPYNLDMNSTIKYKKEV